MNDPRPTTERVMMNFAADLARRSTCGRRQVGAVITDPAMLQVYAIGYNGNARKLANGCDDPDAAGACGCLHAEVNALLKAPGLVAKTMFTTTAPCLMCAKAIVNANVTRVVYAGDYRLAEGLRVLQTAGVEVEALPLP